MDTGTSDLAGAGPLPGAPARAAADALPGVLPDLGAGGVSASVPNWKRERPRGWWDPSRRLLRCVRKWQGWKASSRPWAPLLRRWWALQHRFWTVISQAEVPLEGRIGGGLMLPHPNGVVIHPEAEIGPNCMIFQQVTLGKIASRPGAPRLGGHVDVGAGAKILGPVRIGDHARIGANAVVTSDVAPGRAVAGVPARDIGPGGL